MMDERQISRGRLLIQRRDLHALHENTDITAIAVGPGVMLLERNQLELIYFC